jgi:beta-galactosidase
MKKSILSLLVVTLVFLLNSCINRVETLPRTICFDDGWRFIKDNPQKAEDPTFDDSSWRLLDLPHDWSIEDLPNQTKDSIVGPFSKVSIGKMGTGNTVGGTAWYRKTFKINQSNKNKIVYLQFDGVYMNSDVWVNGKHVGNHPYGYTSFYYNITPYLSPSGENNTIAVQVKNEGVNARWYSGSGIYRHTWLTTTDPVHIGIWGTQVTTPEVSEKSALISVKTTVINEGQNSIKSEISTDILDPLGKVVGTGKATSVIAAGASYEFSQKITVNNPTLWNLDKPELYQAKVSVTSEKNSDQETYTFGIRSIRFDARTGFTLNGKTIKLKGGCFHHDNGPLGAAAIDRAEERKIEIIKKAGFNAIRCSHNPPSPAFLDACDRIGLVVIDEAFDMWEQSKMGTLGSLMSGKEIQTNEYSNHFKTWYKKDIESMVVRDRNHPSVIMWSIGNEIVEAADTSGLRIATNLVNEVRKYDTTRAVTEAHVDMGAIMGGKSTWDSRAEHMTLLNVVGYNYGYLRYEPDHAKYPERVVYGSETNPPLAYENWKLVEKMPNVFGDFTWSGMDYLGEAGTGIPRLMDEEYLKKLGNNQMAIMMQFFSPDSWPAFSNYQGDLDLIGNYKVPYYYRHVVWDESKVEMFVHTPIPVGKKEITSPWGFPDELKSWTWPSQEGKKLQVHVYTKSPLVKLELNGKIVGEQKVDLEKTITATFEIPYQPGTLTAHCFDNGKETATQTLKTVGKPVAIQLVADRSTIKANRNDLSYVAVEILDEQGNLVPNDDRLIHFTLNGNAEIAGVGNGNPKDVSSFQQPQKSTFLGKGLIIVRPKGNSGKISVTAKSDGLNEANIELITQ